MDAIKAIKTRRSIRKYSNKKIPNKKIKKLLELGMHAPSAGNQKPWHFVVIQDSEIFKKIPNFHPHAKMLNQAQLAILICYDINLEKHKDMAIQDCSAATQNILIAANAEGIGSVWLGIYPREERIKGLIELLELPKNIIPFSLISLGYPLEKINKKKIFDPERIHYNQW